MLIQEEGNLHLDAIHLNQIIDNGINLLKDISLSINPGEFVAIAGVSGAGKSTLLNALNGFYPASQGYVLVNGIDYYKNFNAYRTQIGYIPQQDIVHRELTVEEAIDYAAQLRMLPNTTKTERKIRVNQVINDLELTEQRKIPIHSLSGGQVKRVSIGVELLIKPCLFFLDEATSGLDPGTEAELMLLLRELAHRGQTILLITHATENLTLCDRIIFMAKEGNLAYFGSPENAASYFQVEKFNQIYRKLEREKSPEYWRECYLRSPEYQEYVVDRQKKFASTQLPLKQKRKHRLLPKSPVKSISSWQQFLVLSRRNLAILKRDRASLMLMLAVAPILGFLDFFAWQKSLFDPQSGDPRLAITMLFTTGLIAVMVGCLTTIREIVKEEDIYRRERMIGLQIIPYILAKVWIGILLALYQSAIFLGFKLIAMDIPRTPEIIIGVYITLVLATITGMIMGLLGSAIAPNQNVASLIAILFLVPQIIFGGGVLPVETFGLPGQLINHLSITKWPFEALMTITELGKDVANDPCWSLKIEAQNKLIETEKKNCPCSGNSIFKSCNFPGVREAYNSVIDEPMPIKPPELEKPPLQPQENSLIAQQQYQKEIATYLVQISNYQKAIEQWQIKSLKWKEQNERAIGKAEGLIQRFNQDYGATFAVNVVKHWLMLGLLSLVMLVLIAIVQTRKDLI